MRDLKKYAELLQDEFEGLDEISEAKIRGIEEREIQINVDPYRLDAVGLTFEDIAMAVQMENITMGAGEFTADQTRRIIRTVADYKDVSQIANTIIKLKEGKPVYIRDVAIVLDTYKEKSTESRIGFPGEEPKNTISLQIFKKTGGNILDI